MTYDDLVNWLAGRSGLEPNVVRVILAVLPESLMRLEQGESVRTPLGIFRMTRRKARQVILPRTDAPISVPAQMVVKLHAGSKLRKS